MAVTRIWPIRGRLDHPIDYAVNHEKTDSSLWNGKEDTDLKTVLSYAMNEEKTEKQYYVSGINCDAAMAKEEYAITKRQFGKEGGIIAYHGYQSFAEGEVTPDIAHQIGLAFANRMWGEDYQVVVTTHLNTNCLHNHFVVNSVSFLHGRRCRETKWTEIARLSDEICKAYSVSIVENPKGKRLPYTAAKAEARGEPTRLNLARKALDLAISGSSNLNELEAALKNMGYEAKFDVRRKYWTIRQRDWERPIRMARMGKEYTNEKIRSRLLENQKEGPPHPAVFHRKAGLHYTKSRKTARRISGLRGLYLYYCYRLGYFHHQQNPKWVYYLYRDDLLKLHNITAEARLLCENKIDSAEELFIYQKKIEGRIDRLCQERKRLSNDVRHVGITMGEKERIRERKNEISGQLKRLRRKVHLCNGIFERSESVREKLELGRTEEASKERKKERRDER